MSVEQFEKLFVHSNIFEQDVGCYKSYKKGSGVSSESEGKQVDLAMLGEVLAFGLQLDIRNLIALTVIPIFGYQYHVHGCIMPIETLVLYNVIVLSHIN